VRKLRCAVNALSAANFIAKRQGTGASPRRWRDFERARQRANVLEGGSPLPLSAPAFERAADYTPPQMDLDLFERMDVPELRSYIEFFLRHYRVIDALCFIFLTERFGQEAAEKVNEQVWGRVGGMPAKDIVRYKCQD
jgi:hypothetical protein